MRVPLGAVAWGHVACGYVAWGCVAWGYCYATALAQSPPSPYPTMPGAVVGRPAPIGTAFPSVGRQPGAPIGFTGPNGQPINPGQRPTGQIIDLSKLAAPLTAPLPPELAGNRPKGPIEKLFDQWRAMLGFQRTDKTPTSGYFPGLSRRNRERHKTGFRWD